MVGSGYVVKLGDFGMARAMYDSDYYRFGRKGKMILIYLYQFYRKIQYLTREFRVKLHVKTDIAGIAKR